LGIRPRLGQTGKQGRFIINNGKVMAQTNKVGKHMTKITTNKEGGKVVTYRGCPVFTEYPKQGKVELNTCGWRSNTTKTRMNQAANQFGIPVHVFQKDFEWYVTPRYGHKDKAVYGSTKGSSKVQRGWTAESDMHVVSGLVL